MAKRKAPAEGRIPVKESRLARLQRAFMIAHNGHGYLTCAENGEVDGEISANVSDYFLYPPDHALTCGECGAPMELVSKEGFSITMSATVADLSKFKDRL